MRAREEGKRREGGRKRERKRERERERERERDDDDDDDDDDNVKWFTFNLFDFLARACKNTCVLVLVFLVTISFIVIPRQSATSTMPA